MHAEAIRLHAEAIRLRTEANPLRPKATCLVVSEVAAIGLVIDRL